jgi:hypothetical protein
MKVLGYNVKELLVASIILFTFPLCFYLIDKGYMFVRGLVIMPYRPLFIFEMILYLCIILLLLTRLLPLFNKYVGDANIRNCALVLVGPVITVSSMYLTSMKSSMFLS